MQRGPRYKAYADLRESRLRTKLTNNPPENQDSVGTPTPLKTQIKFQGQRSFQATTTYRRKGSCVLTPQIPNLSKNENRKPVLPSAAEKYGALAGKSSSRIYESNSRLGGGKSSVPAADKRRNGLLTAIRSSRRAMQTWMK